MFDIKLLTLLPQDQLLLASNLEIQAVHRHRRFAFSFLPYDTRLSRRISELGIACEQRLEALRGIAESLGLGACVALPGARDGRETPGDRPTLPFVVDDAMAEQALQEALAASLQAYRFAHQLLETNGTPELERPLLDGVHQKQLECNVLMKSHALQGKRA